MQNLSYLIIKASRKSNELIQNLISISDKLTTNIFSIYLKEKVKELTKMIYKLIEGTEE